MRQLQNFRPAVIYSLTDPISGDRRYVGITVNVETRTADHARHPCNRDCYLWLQKLQSDGYSPIVEILEYTSFPLGLERENYWITKLMGEGVPLTNKRYRAPRQIIGNTKTVGYKAS